MFSRSFKFKQFVIKVVANDVVEGSQISWNHAEVSVLLSKIYIIDSGELVVGSPEMLIQRLDDRRWRCTDGSLWAVIEVSFSG